MSEAALPGTGAVLCTGIAGYRARIDAGESELAEATAEVLRARIAPAVEAQGGRMLPALAGEALAVFAHPVQALQAAIAVQQGLEAHNADLAERNRLEMRIGLDQGAVSPDGARPTGEAVLTAMQLRDLAAPLGVLVSDACWRMAAAAIGRPARKVGRERIAATGARIDLWALDWRAPAVGPTATVVGTVAGADAPRGPAAPRARAPAAAKPQSRMKAISRIAALVILVSAGFLFPYVQPLVAPYWERLFGTADRFGDLVLAGPPRLVIEGGGAAGAALLAAINALAGQALARTEPAAAGEAPFRLGFRPASAQSGTVLASLRGPAGDGVLWSQRIRTGPRADARDPALRRIAVEIAFILLETESRQIFGWSGVPDRALEKILEGWLYQRRTGAVDLQQAAALWGEAARLAPEHPAPAALLALMSWRFEQRGLGAPGLDRARLLARAEARAPRDPLVRALRAMAKLADRDLIGAQGLATEAAADAPVHPIVQEILALVSVGAGNGPAALDAAERAARASRIASPWSLRALSLAYRAVGDLARAQDLARRAGLPVAAGRRNQ